MRAGEAEADLDARSVGSALIAPRSERPERKVFIKLSIQARLSDLPGKRFLLRYLSHLYGTIAAQAPWRLNFTASGSSSSSSSGRA